ncbi:MAG: hypothetical protein ABIK62_03020 [candidate division WOR-3 bacterium]
MIVAFPYFGTGTIALRMFFQDLGARVMLPPVPTRRTLELGVLHSPEQICLPFKITLGSLIEAAELGAEALFMAAGTRKCRFGYYHLLQETILARLHPNVRFYGLAQYSVTDFVFRRVPEIFGISPRRVAVAVANLLRRSALIAEFDRQVRRLRALDFPRAEAAIGQGLRMLERIAQAGCIPSVRRDLRRLFNTGQKRPEMRIALIGEVYLLSEPFANLDIERQLGRLGVEVVLERSLYNHLRHLLKSEFRFIQTALYARRYIQESPGGEVVKTLGEAVRQARAGVGGIVHIFPFTCMPENMALEILQKIGRDYRVPVMSLSFDEHTGQAGLVTRLEAFVDVVRRQRLRVLRKCA